MARPRKADDERRVPLGTRAPSGLLVEFDALAARSGLKRGPAIEKLMRGAVDRARAQAEQQTPPRTKRSAQ